MRTCLRLLAALCTLATSSVPAQAEPPPRPPSTSTAPVALRLTTPQGAACACTIDLARYHGPDRPLRSLLPADGFTPRKLTANDFAAGTATLHDLPRGTFVFLVTGEQHARAVSAPFRVGDSSTEVAVQMVVGATVFGRIQDEAGKPIAGATVTADATQPSDQTAAATLDPSWRPVPRLTQVQAVTDAQGQFELPHLALGLYSVRVGHPDWCPSQQDLPEPLADRERRDLGVVALRRGALVQGRIVDARRRSVQVMLEMPADNAGDRAQAPTLPTSIYAQPDGSFAFLQRVPPGRYRLRGDFDDPATPFAFRKLPAFDLEVVVPAGQQQVVVPALALR